VYASHGWEIDLARRELRSRGVPVPLGSRAFEILEILVQSAGELVGKYELMGRVWQGAIVEENTLQFHISAIRKTLAADRALLKTVSGRGYRLLGTWTIRQGSKPVHTVELGLEGRPEQASRHNLPVATSALIGRATARQHLLDVISAYRLVTLTGPGGIGKSVLGLDVARALFSGYSGDCWLVELASLSDPALVPSAVARVLGLRLGGDEISVEAVAQGIGDNKILLVLDNCEHVVDAVAALADAIVRICPHVSILATSRENLRIAGEYVWRVPPLDVPPESSEDSGTVHEYSAVQLFIARMRALDPAFSAEPESLPTIATVCRCLDGIPLAIEFAAARVATLGLQQVATRLDDRFSLLTAGRRTALPRHQTLRATLDWSYELLPEPEQRLLRRLAVFAGGVTLEAATAIMRDTDATASAVADRIASLVAKSLVTLEGMLPSGRWRLLETTRAYAFEKLAEAGEADQIARCHAEFFRDLISAAASGAQLVSDIAPYAREIDNVRAALAWSFSSPGDNEIGVALTAAYCPVLLDLWLFVECRDRAEHALGRLGTDPKLSPLLEMQLHVGLGIALILTLGPVERTKIALTAGLHLAERSEDLDAQARALWALWALHFNLGDDRVALSVAERFAMIGVRDPVIAPVAHRIVGYTMQYMGRQLESRANLENAIELSRRSHGQRQRFWFLYDQQLLARASLARSLWLQGFVEQAENNAHACLADAQAVDDKLTVCFVLGLAVCPIALMTGDLIAAARYVDMLIDAATRQRLSQYLKVGRRLEGMLLIERGEFAAGCVQLREALEISDRTGWTIGYPEFLGALAKGLAGLGGLAEALATVDQGLARAEESGECWYVPELLRIRGELLLRNGADEAIPTAENCFKRALVVAQEQGATFWELRAATSLARLRASQNRHEEARQVLAPVYQRFTEGHETADMRVARTVLEELPPHRA
jgi:predicted ATPase/DNA-binding winged helix-turn-helix (wHTH) protein